MRTPSLPQITSVVLPTVKKQHFTRCAQTLTACVLTLLGLAFNLSMCALLLPSGHTITDADRNFFADITVCIRGMKVAGAPIYLAFLIFFLSADPV